VKKPRPAAAAAAAAAASLKSAVAAACFTSTGCVNHFESTSEASTTVSSAAFTMQYPWEARQLNSADWGSLSSLSSQHFGPATVIWQISSSLHNAGLLHCNPTSSFCTVAKS
jgi:hypothetical protein